MVSLNAFTFPLKKLIFKVTCIVPVYNNQDTIAKVVATLLEIKDITEVIVINDGSYDLTQKKLSNFIDHKKCNIISTAKNKGKGWAIAMGISEAKGNVILMCDADLKNLRDNHIEQMMNQFKKSKSQMVISSRSPLDGFKSRFFAKLSGERIFYKKSLTPKYLKLMKHSGYGVEKIINHAHRDKQIDFVVAGDIGHQLKFHRSNWPKCTKEYLEEAVNVIGMDLRLKLLRDD